MKDYLTLTRFAYTPQGTFGSIILPGGRKLYTVERPWFSNQQSTSCIPEGVYTLEKRYSPVVQRTSRGKYSDGWEVTNVPRRTYIMWHPGNTMEDLEGCVAPGLDLGYIGRLWAVTSSQIAFDYFMTALADAGHERYTLDIRPFRADYP